MKYFIEWKRPQDYYWTSDNVFYTDKNVLLEDVGLFKSEDAAANEPKDYRIKIVDYVEIEELT